MVAIVTCRLCLRVFEIVKENMNAVERINLVVAWHTERDGICPECEGKGES